MIRNAVLHLLSEQPLLADLYRLPEAADSGLLCTNLRMLNGKRPVFIDDSASTFFFPYRQMRFVEIPAGSGGSGGPAANVGAEAPAGPPVAPEPGSPASDLELDEELIRRVREI